MAKLQVKIKPILKGEFKMPVKGSDNAACFDVYAHSITFPGPEKICIGLGFSTEIPKGWKGVIVPRSNLTKHHWIMNNNVGIIDSDYRGEWMMVLTSLKNMASNPLPYVIGDRVAQVYFDKVTDMSFVASDELSNTVRGKGGFGSTGLKEIV